VQMASLVPRLPTVLLRQVRLAGLVGFIGGLIGWLPLD